MSVKQFSKDWKFQKIVRIAIKRRLTYKEAIAAIVKNGFPKISEKTYQRAKTELKSNEHLKDIAIEGFDEYSLDTIETTAAVDAELWDVVRTTNDPWVKLKAIKMIMENCSKKPEDFESGKALSYVSDEIESAKTKKKEPEKKSGISEQGIKEEENVEENKEPDSN